MRRRRWRRVPSDPARRRTAGAAMVAAEQEPPTDSEHGDDGKSGAQGHESAARGPAA